MLLQALVVLGELFGSNGSAFSGPSDGDGFVVDDVSTEVAVVLEEVSRPLRISLLTRAEDLNIFEDDLLVRGIGVALGVLFEDNVQDAVLLVVTLVVLLDVDDLRRRNTSVQISLNDAISLSGLAEESHLTAELVTGLSRLGLRIGVILRAPLEIFSIQLPMVTHPGVNGLN